MSKDCVFEFAVTRTDPNSIAKEFLASANQILRRGPGLLLQVMAAPNETAGLDVETLERKLQSYAPNVLVETVPSSLLPDWPGSPVMVLRCMTLTSDEITDRRAWLDSIRDAPAILKEVTLEDDGEKTDVVTEAIQTEVQSASPLTHNLRWRAMRAGKEMAQGMWPIPSEGLTFGLTGGAPAEPHCATLDGPAGPLGRGDTTYFKDGRRVGRFSKKQFQVSVTSDLLPILTVLGKAPMVLYDPAKRTKKTIAQKSVSIGNGEFWSLSVGDFSLEFISEPKSVKSN